jgi:hypothetical protein
LLLPLCIPHRYSVVYAVSSPVLMALPQSIGGLCVPSCVRLEASPYLPANPVKSQAILHIALLSVCLSVRLSHPAVPQPRGGLDDPACVRQSHKQFSTLLSFLSVCLTVCLTLQSRNHVEAWMFQLVLDLEQPLLPKDAKIARLMDQQVGIVILPFLCSERTACQEVQRRKGCAAASIGCPLTLWNKW